MLQIFSSQNDVTALLGRRSENLPVHEIQVIGFPALRSALPFKNWPKTSLVFRLSQIPSEYYRSLANRFFWITQFSESES